MCMHAGAGPDARSGNLKDAAYGILFALDDITHAAAQARAKLDVFIAAAGAYMNAILSNVLLDQRCLASRPHYMDTSRQPFPLDLALAVSFMSASLCFACLVPESFGHDR